MGAGFGRKVLLESVVIDSGNILLLKEIDATFVIKMRAKLVIKMRAKLVIPAVKHMLHPKRIKAGTQFEKPLL